MDGTGIPASADSSEGPPRRGRPRSKQSEQAILLAAADLLVERGLGAMSIEEVAARAGVGKATIYRRWSTRGTLALDAFVADYLKRQPLPDTGSLRGDLTAALRAWVRLVTRTPVGRTLTGLLAEAQRDPGLATAWTKQVIGPVRAEHRIMVRRAIARGEIPAETDADVVMDLLYGSAYHRLLQGHLPLTDRFVLQVVELVMRALARATTEGGRRRR
ncbi:MAG: TetR/AcrR family transcriptional regulator [Acidimicrobiales bacterium]|nr:TetR/AcrR family transcriptional regulator [Acidimicrobiales bacterium]